MYHNVEFSCFSYNFFHIIEMVQGFFLFQNISYEILVNQKVFTIILYKLFFFTLGKTSDMLRKTNYSAIIGPQCSQVCSFVGRLAAYYNIACFSGVCQDTEMLDKTVFTVREYQSNQHQASLFHHSPKLHCNSTCIFISQYSV